MMSTMGERDVKVDAMHARITEARVAIRRAVAINSRAPCFAGSQDAFRALTEADRLLNNVAACLPWKTKTT